jgi:acylphosphatase
MAKVRYRVLISGWVQGVNFRAATRREAQAHGVTGWVRNRSDGTVEAVFEGEAGDVERMVAWCRHGPPAADVIDVVATPEAYTSEFTEFSIRFSA